MVRDLSLVEIEKLEAEVRELEKAGVEL